MVIKNNALVIYKSKAAVVLEISNDKYTIRTTSGERKSVRLKDIELLHAGPCTTVPEAAAAPGNDVLAENAELIGGDEMSFADFTELLWGCFSPAAALAAWELLNRNCYFNGTPGGPIKANPPEHIAAILSKEEQKLQQQAARTALLERIRTNTITSEDASSLREIENVAYGESTSSKLMHDLGMEALPEKAQNLLIKLGFWNYFDHNPWFRRFGLELPLDYPELSMKSAPEERLDLTHLAAYAIDDATSNDPDDAISYDSENDLLWVHVADPASVIDWDSDLEKFACSNGCTLYAPEAVHTMLPPQSVELFGLGLSETSPALSMALKIDDSGNSQLANLTLSTVKVTRMDYTQAEELMQQGVFAGLLAAVERFRQYRIANNAVMIKLPEVKVKTDISARKICITPLPQSPARELVANAMLAAGHAVGKFAVEHDIAMPFSVQSDPEMSERPDTLPGMYALRKSCRQSTLSTLPGKHAGLGLEPYVRVTSPLRRYEDLLAHIQLRRYLAGKTPLSMSEMDERIAVSEAAAVLRSKLERQCREYWTMVYLQSLPENYQGEAIYIAKPDDRSVWLLPELAFEFKNRYNTKLALGESVQVECIASDPVLLSAQFRINA